MIFKEQTYLERKMKFLSAALLIVFFRRMLLLTPAICPAAWHPDLSIQPLYPCLEQESFKGRAS
jgi:hypothetical protein